jgi:hypothetical protein
MVMAGCCSAPDRTEVVYRDRLVPAAADAKQACLAQCRLELVDVLDRCYRDARHFVPQQNTVSGRERYLGNVRACIATGRFTRYRPGVEMCEGICTPEGR